MNVTIIFRDVEIGPGSEGAALMAFTTHFGERREVVFQPVVNKPESVVAIDPVGGTYDAGPRASKNSPVGERGSETL